MRFIGILIFIAYVIGSAIPDVLDLAIAEVQRLHLIPYHLKDYLGYVLSAPWKPVVFALSFGTIATITAEPHNKPDRDDIIAFMLIVPLIFIILQYGLGFAVPLLGIAHINPYLFAKSVAGLFIALVAWKGLHIPLGGLGVFLVTLLSLLMAVTVVAGIPSPIPTEAFWFTIIGSAMAVPASFGRSR